MSILTPFDDRGEDAGNTVFRDVIMLALVGFVALVILMLPHIQPKGSRASEEVVSPGNVITEIRWPDEADADVDLWVRAPGDVAVGYSNKGGALFNLLRDDLGNRADATGLNYETSYTRGVVAGKYTVNIHLYRFAAKTFPLKVTVVLSVKKPSDKGKGSAKQLLASVVEFLKEGEELTAFNFDLTAEGDLVPESVDMLYTPLRAKGTGGST